MINQSAKRIALYARVSTSKCEKCGRRQSDHETLSANPWIGARRFPSGVRWIATGGQRFLVVYNLTDPSMNLPLFSFWFYRFAFEPSEKAIPTSA